MSKYKENLNIVSIILLMWGIISILRYSYTTFMLSSIEAVDLAAYTMVLKSLYLSFFKSGLQIICGIVGILTIRGKVDHYLAVGVGIFLILAVMVMQFFDFALLQIIGCIIPALYVFYAWKLKKEDSLYAM